MSPRQTSPEFPAFLSPFPGACLRAGGTRGRFGSREGLSARAAPARMALAPPPPRPPVEDRAPPAPAPEPWCAALVGRDALEGALEAAGDAFVVVIFVAQWCRTCKTLLTKVQRLSRAHPEIRFLTVDFVEDANKALCAGLNVKLLPTFHFYQSPDDAADFKAQFTAGPFGIKRLVERLEEFDISVNMD